MDRQFGSSILAAPNNLLRGEVEGEDLLDMARTLLELGGYDIPRSMRGKSPISGKILDTTTNVGCLVDEEKAIRQRLEGIGHIF